MRLLLEHGASFNGLDLGDGCRAVFGCGKIADVVEDVDRFVDAEGVSGVDG